MPELPQLSDDRWAEMMAPTTVPPVLDSADVDGPICDRPTCVAEGDCACHDGGSLIAKTGKETR